MESDKSTPRLNGVARLVLGTFTTIHCLLHVVLFVASSIAWSTMLKLAKHLGCDSNGGVDCGFPGWLFYSFITPTALICAVVLAVLAVRTWAATNGAPFNPLYIFRGLVFTTLLLTPFIYFGWSSSRFALEWFHLSQEFRHLLRNLGCFFQEVDQPATNATAIAACRDDGDDYNTTVVSMLGCPAGHCDPHQINADVIRGFLARGIFIASNSAKFAWSLAHFNVLHGAFIAGISAALAPKTGGSVDAQNLAAKA